MAERINTAARNRQADFIGDDFNSGTLKMYTGTQPASGNDAPTGTLLVTINLPADAMAAAVNGVAAKLGTWSGVAVADGDMGWFRVTNSAANRNYDGAITVTAGDGEIKFPSLAVLTGRTVIIGDFTITQPAG